MTAPTSNRTVVLVDADNTLWDTDGVFARAQLNLLRTVERATNIAAPETDRLAFVRNVDQALAERHHLGLRYPARLLAQAVARALAGADPDAAAKSVWKDARQDLLPNDVAASLEQSFVADLRKQAALLPGVKNGLRRLRDIGAQIIVLTEGDRVKAAAATKRLGIATYVDRVLESRKTVELFQRIVRLVSPARHCFMIGDQLLRDIGPANDAGVTTIYIAGRFRPRWELSEQSIPPVYRADGFDDAVDFIIKDTAATDDQCQKNKT